MKGQGTVQPEAFSNVIDKIFMKQKGSSKQSKRAGSSSTLKFSKAAGNDAHSDSSFGKGTEQSRSLSRHSAKDNSHRKESLTSAKYKNGGVTATMTLSHIDRQS